MRNQLNELSSIATDLRNLLIEHKSILENVTVISDNIKVHSAGTHYMSIVFSAFPNKMEIGVYDADKFKQNTVTIDIARVGDADLDAILLRSKEEIAIFKHRFEQQLVAKRRMRILELQDELDKLFVDVDVHTSTPSI